MFPNRLLDALLSGDEDVCMEAVESSGDLLEYGDWSAYQATPVFEALLRLVVDRDRHALKEAALNSLILGLSRDTRVELCLMPLVETLPHLEAGLISSALEVLGLSRSSAYLDVLRGYASSPDPTLSEAARNAVCEIGSGRSTSALCGGE